MPLTTTMTMHASALHDRLVLPFLPHKSTPRLLRLSLQCGWLSAILSSLILPFIFRLVLIRFLVIIQFLLASILNSSGLQQSSTLRPITRLQAASHAASGPLASQDSSQALSAHFLDKAFSSSYTLINSPQPGDFTHAANGLHMCMGSAEWNHICR